MSSRAGMASGAKVYVAGHRGLEGSALVRGLRAAGFDNLVTRAHAELDLGDAVAVRTGDLWIGDVGQDRFEEVDRATQASGGGAPSTSAGGS